MGLLNNKLNINKNYMLSQKGDSIYITVFNNPEEVGFIFQIHKTSNSYYRCTSHNPNDLFEIRSYASLTSLKHCFKWIENIVNLDPEELKKACMKAKANNEVE